MRLICEEIKDANELKVGDFYIIKPDLFSNPFVCDLYFGKLCNIDWIFSGFKWEKAFSGSSLAKTKYSFFKRYMQERIDTKRIKVYKILNLAYAEYLYKNNEFLKLSYHNLISLITQQ